MTRIGDGSQIDGDSRVIQILIFNGMSGEGYLMGVFCTETQRTQDLILYPNSRSHVD